jgi:hypothetical protein
MHRAISTFVFLFFAGTAFGADASEATVKAALLKKYPDVRWRA